MTRTEALHLLDLPAEPSSLAVGSAIEFLLRSICEIDVPVSRLALPAVGIGRDVLAVTRRPLIAELLQANDCAALVTFDAIRALERTRAHIEGGRGGVVFVPNELLGETLPHWEAFVAQPFVTPNASMTVLVEDDPRHHLVADPRHIAESLGVPTLEASDIEDLRRALDVATRMSRAVRRATMVVAHESILRTFDTVPVLEDRRSAATSTPGRRRHRTRSARAEPGDVRRLARRLEVNETTAMPNPGERVPTGFITVGPAGPCLEHLVQVLELSGRVPFVRLRMVQPLDDVVIARLLDRVDNVVVLEPRPGAIESQVLRIAERMRHDGARPAAVWGRVLPPIGGEPPYVVRGDELLHPSILARRIVHLLHATRPSVHVGERLHDVAAPTVPAQAPRRRSSARETLRTLLEDSESWVNTDDVREERGLDVTSVAYDGMLPGRQTGRTVLTESMAHDDFIRRGFAAVRHLAARRAPSVLMVIVMDDGERQNLERLARGMIPGEHADRSSTVSVSLAVRNEVRDALRAALAGPGLTLMLVAASADDDAAVTSSMREIDTLGFEARQRFTVPAEFCCRAAATPIEDVAVARPPTESPVPTGLLVDQLGDRIGARMRVRVRALLEHVDVFREAPPAATWRRAGHRLPVPTPIHGHLPVWRAHLAGIRGEGIGLAGSLLARAGRVMGYVVRGWHDPAPVGRGLHNWTQILFTQPRTDRQGTLPAIALPFGEAHLLLGHDRTCTVDAIDPHGHLHVAAREQTCAVVDGAVDDEHELGALLGARLDPALTLLVDARSSCRTWFHTDRVLDIVLLGAAYQRGWIPVTLDAMETAIAQLESIGFGELASGFHLGRRIVAAPESAVGSNYVRDEPVARLSRRLSIGLQTVSWGGDQTAGDFRRLVDRGLTGMPGLVETSGGERARRQFVLAIYGAMLWGGTRYAEQYADRVLRLYQVEAHDVDRSLTRAAIHPLAEALLIPDTIFVATMTGSPFYRGRLRQELNVRRSRGDRLVRAIITRFELVGFGHRVRFHARMTEGTARILSRWRRIVPGRWRGTRRDRELRRVMTEFIDRAIHLAPQRYDELVDAMTRIDEIAQSGRLRRLPRTELRGIMRNGVGTLATGTDVAADAVADDASEA